MGQFTSNDMTQRFTHLEMRHAIASMREGQTLWELLSPVGPSDGGCFVCALALQQVIGGSLRAVVDDSDTIHHVFVLTEQGAYDGAKGYSSDDELLRHWKIHELPERRIATRDTTAREVRLDEIAFNGEDDFQHGEQTLNGWELVDAISQLLCSYLNAPKMPEQSAMAIS